MEKSWAADYKIEGNVYRIYEKSETHSRLCTDVTFLKTYVAESTANPEFVAVVDADEVDRPGIFKWHTQATKYFIDMYMERKDKFRDPKIRKKTLWSTGNNSVSLSLSLFIIAVIFVTTTSTSPKKNSITNSVLSILFAFINF